MGILWSTNPEEDVKNNFPVNEDPSDNIKGEDEEEDLPFLDEVEKRELAAKRLAYISAKYPKPKTFTKTKEKDSEDQRYDQYLKDLRS